MTTAFFDTVKRARAQVARWPDTNISTETSVQYEAEMQRIFRVAKTADEAIALVLATRKVSTRLYRRAVIKNKSAKLLRLLLKKQDILQRSLRGVPNDAPEWNEWIQTVQEMRLWSELLDMIDGVGGPDPETRKRRHSKRSDLKGLPLHWRELLAQHMPLYRLPVLLSAVSGLRPAELTKGARVWIEGGHLVVEIQGSKIGHHRGQPWRRLSWSLTHPSPLVQALVADVSAGVSTIKIDCPKRFQSAVRAAGKRLWPDHQASLSPYCLRHQFASDLKAAGMADAEISAALGHCSSASKSTYGHYLIGRTGQTNVKPDRIEAARAVKVVSRWRFKAAAPKAVV